MSNLQVALAVATATKTCVQTGTPSVNETVDFRVTGVTGPTAANLRLTLTRNGQLMAQCVALTADGEAFVATIDMATDAFKMAMGVRRAPNTREFRVCLQDVAQKIDYLNDVIEVLDNPYETGMAEPEIAESIPG